MNSLTSRRTFLASLAALAATQAFPLASNALAPASKFTIAYTSFPIRMRAARGAGGAAGPAVAAEAFIELCHSFGAQGCQMDIAQLASNDADYLKRVRALLEAKQMSLEISVGMRTLETADGFGRALNVANALGITRIRTACLGGRRYEDFHELAKWREFEDHWKAALKTIEPSLKKNKLVLGVENHKDWLADDLAALMKSISSEWLGVCVDFGNNLSLLEDSLEVARKLAPYVVTTHVKDMAVRPTADGFEMSEVPLGEGSTPLRQIVSILRQRRPDVDLCLEMITRDPLQVPYKTDGYWATFGKRDQARIDKFERTVLAKPAREPLPRVTGLSPQQAQEMEDGNIRRSADYTKQKLKF